MTTFEDSLNTGAGQSFRFDAVGSLIRGTVTGKSMVDTTDFDGNPETVPVVTIDTGDGEYDVWMSKNALKGAVGKALAAHGAGTTLAVGGKLAIKRIEDGAPRKAGYAAPHLFEAKYQPPAPTDDFDLGTPEPAPAPAPAPAAPATQPATDDEPFAGL